jgi:hypothetical protein
MNTLQLIREERWKVLTQTANEQFERGEHSAALANYLETLTIAETMLQDAKIDPSAIPVIPIYVVSCHNLAEYSQCMKRSQECCAFLRRAHQTLLTLFQDQTCPQPLRQQCLCDLSKTLGALVRCLRKQRTQEITALIKETKDMVKQTLPTVRH